MRSKYVYLLLLIIYTSYFLNATEVDEYTIGFELLVMNQIDDTYMYLASSIPELLYYELKNIPTHIYSKEEMFFLRKKYYDDLQKEYSLELSKSIEEYNTYLFSTKFNRDKYISLGEKVESNQKLLVDLEDSSTFIQKPSVNVKYNIDETSFNILESKTLEKSDLIIKGSMEKLDNWIYLQIWIKNNISGKEERVYESISSPDTIIDLIPEITNNIKTVVLGRPWASIEFDLIPEGSSIIMKIDNEQILPKEFQFLVPGIYDIEVTTFGFIPQKIKIELEEYETRVLPISLEEEKRVTISVQSFPSGADVYSGSVMLGKTPLLTEQPITPSFLTLKLKDYNDKKIVYTDKNRDFQILMQSNIVNTDKIIISKREKFYKSFSYFLLSIPVSLISYGVSSDFGYSYDREILASGNTGESDRLMKLSNSWYNVYLGGVFFNITLFANMLFDLAGYIKSNNQF